MIQITRNIAREVRAVFKRLLCGKRRKINPTVQFDACPAGLFIRSVTLDGAIQYHVAGEFPVLKFAVPLSTLEACEGKNEQPVQFNVTPNDQVAVEWQEGRVPRQQTVSQAIWKEDSFPTTPPTFVANPAELLIALRDASQNAADDASRYVLDHLQLDGAKGKIAATDGKHLLVQTGFQFPWPDAVLVPASSVFGSAELPHDQPVGIAASENWLSLSIGDWLIHLPINKDGRFPKTDEIIPRPARIVSRLQIAAEDVTFLTDALRRLPGDDGFNHPITLDLNGEVIVRATAEDQPRPTELVLSQSRLIGDPVRININREYLARAIRLGFREVGLIDANGILTCDDGQRKYLWMPLEFKSAIKPTTDAMRIESNAADPASQRPDPSSTTSLSTSKLTIPMTRMTKPKHNSPKSDEATCQPSTDSPTLTSTSTNAPPSTSDKTSTSPITNPLNTNPIIAAIELRTSLRTTLTDLNNLIASLRRTKRQQQIVATTLQSLKELQKVAG